MFTSSRHDRPQIDRDFLCEHHRELAAAVAAFAEHDVRPRIPQWETSGELEHDLIRDIARRGWIGATIPTAYGGLGLDHRSKLVIVDQLSRVSGTIGAAVQAGDIPVAMFLHIATPQQRQHWLPRLASGRTLATIAVTEPFAGGHILGIDTTATRDGDHYVLTGTKAFVGNSHIADLHAVIARTGENELSVFVVDSRSPGLSLQPYTATLGLRGFSFGDLELDHVDVDVDSRLGEQGDGRDAAYLASIVHGRLDIAAVALGLHHALLEATVDYAGDHPRLSRHQTVQQRIGTMQSNLMTARQVVHHAAWLLDQGADCDRELLNAKLVAADLARDSAQAAQEIFGARALRATHLIERLIRDIQHFWAPAGTADIQRYRLWQHAIGAAKTSWSQRCTTRN